VKPTITFDWVLLGQLGDYAPRTVWLAKKGKKTWRPTTYVGQP